MRNQVHNIYDIYMHFILNIPKSHTFQLVRGIALVGKCAICETFQAFFLKNEVTKYLKLIISAD